MLDVLTALPVTNPDFYAELSQPRGGPEKDPKRGRKICKDPKPKASGKNGQPDPSSLRTPFADLDDDEDDEDGAERPFSEDIGEDDENVPVADIIAHVCFDGQHSAAYMEQNGYLLTAGSQAEGEDPLPEDDPSYDEQDVAWDAEDDNEDYEDYEGPGTDEVPLQASAGSALPLPRPKRDRKKVDLARLYRFWDD